MCITIAVINNTICTTREAEEEKVQDRIMEFHTTCTITTVDDDTTCTTGEEEEICH